MAPQVTLRDGGLTATVHLPAMKHADLQYKGANVINAVALMIRAKLALWVHPSHFINKAKQNNPELGHFILSQFYTISRDCYEILSKVSEAQGDVLFGPFHCESTVSQVGSSSYLWNLHMYDSASGSLLMEEKSTYILVSLVTRRPHAIPPGLREHSQLLDRQSSHPSFHWRKEDFQYTHLPLKSSKTFTKRFTDEHIDGNNHVSFLFYLIFATEFVEQKWNPENSCKLQCGKLSVLYRGEAVSGDLVEYHVQRVKEADAIYVDLLKHGGDITKIKFEQFYDSSNSNSDPVLSRL